jgi:pimeloyl-ACP methyl ester carboxylesterase
VALLIAVEYGPWIERAAFERLDERVLAAPEHFPSHAETVAYLATRYPRITPAALESRARHGTRPAPEGIVWKYARDAIAQSLRLLDADLGSLVARVQAPTLIVRGGESTFYDAAAFRRLQQARPDFEYIELPGATHYVPEEWPDLLAERILQFIERHGADLARPVAGR